MNARAQTPELAKHLRAIAKGNELDREWMANERLDELVWLCDVAISHLISAREAAWRRDKALLGDHLRHGREGLVVAIKAFNALSAETGQDRA